MRRCLPRTLTPPTNTRCGMLSTSANPCKHTTWGRQESEILTMTTQRAVALQKEGIHRGMPFLKRCYSLYLVSCSRPPHPLHSRHDHTIPQVFRVDDMGRDTVVGYGSVLIPTQAGRHDRVAHMYAPQPSSMLQRLRAWVSGAYPEVSIRL